MRPLRIRLLEARSRLGVGWETLERDYVLSWVLAGISRLPELHENLAFKGGAALKKCYFARYRFSEDLDFSGMRGLPRGDSLEKAMRTVCGVSARLLEQYAPVALECDRYTEREPHPTGQEAFIVRCRLPWHRQPHVRIMVEITVDEPVLRPVRQRKVTHEYGEPLNTDMGVYSLAEIIAEKLRAILQQAKILKERGWSRSRARDYYDLWFVLRSCGEELDLSGLESLLRLKCDVRDVVFGGPGDFFPEPVLGHVERTWEQWLGPLVAELPPFHTVIGDLRSELPRLLSGSG